MNKRLKLTNNRCRFDFEIGYLSKSPCKGCKTRHRFPACIDKCQIIDQLHALMAESVSVARNR